MIQIENEYGNVEGAFHEKGASYVRWAAKMAVDRQTGVPWVMCKQTDAPDPVVIYFILILYMLLINHNLSCVSDHL